jgi:hypothetical protein
VIGRFIVDVSDDLRIIKQRQTHPGPTYTWDEVKAYLSTLEGETVRREQTTSLTLDDDQARILQACVEAELLDKAGYFLGRAINSDAKITDVREQQSCDLRNI